MALLILLLAACDPAVLAKAAEANAFDLRGTLAVVRTAGECDEAAGTGEYLEGLLGAAEAVEKGGTVESLREVRSAANALSRRAEQGNRRWEVASLALRAAAAASQQERSEMGLYLAEALRIEALLLAGRLPGAPIISAHELAGDLWFQVHQFADARAAYLRAGSAVGYTPRVRLGLARTADRLEDSAGACGEYRGLLEWWRSVPRASTPQVIADAEARARALGCVRGQ
jgi:hypothetical protein